MPTFTPRSEEELSNLIPHKSVCNFQVISTDDKPSKTGNEMITLQLKVWDDKGREHILTDHLVFSDRALFKVKHFCESVGIAEQYNAGQLEAFHCQDKSGKAHIIIEKDASGQYPDKNKIKDYVPESAKTVAPKPDFDDDIPF